MKNLVVDNDKEKKDVAEIELGRDKNTVKDRIVASKSRGVEIVELGKAIQLKPIGRAYLLDGEPVKEE